jgi:glutathione S-transferase
VPSKPTLHVCHYDRAGAGFHACRRADDALREAGIDHDRVVFGPNKPMGLFTAGTRPELKAMSGQETLPVLELTDGTTVNGCDAIIAWAEANAVVA